MTLITVEAASADVYPLPAAVDRIALGLERPSPTAAHAIANAIRRAWFLRRAVSRSQPDVVLSFVDRTNVLVLLATVGLQAPVLVSERIDPRYNPIGRPWTLLRRLVYRRAAAVVVQTEAAAGWARNLGGVRRVVIVPNGVRGNSPGSALREATVVGVGRLTHQKGFDLLLQAFAAVADRHPHWRVAIAGTGPAEQELLEQAATLEIADRVELRGWVQNPQLELEDAGIFVLSSRYEGFPNALLEALAAGAPAIAFDCPSGPADIVRDGIDGILVPPNDVDALAEALDRLMGNPDARARLSDAARGVAARFADEAVLARWGELVDELAA